MGNLEGGIYSLRSLRLEKDSILIFNGPTTINIQEKLTGDSNIAILPGQNFNQNDLQINFKGEKHGDNDKDDKKDKKDKKGKKDKDKRFGFIHFGKNSFLNFKLLASNATVRLGKQTTFRGQILADEVHIGKGSILSREESFEKESDLSKIIELPTNVRLISNEIVILFNLGATINDLLDIASLVNGQVTGFLPEFDMGKIEVDATNFVELENIINTIKSFNSPLIEDVLPNTLVF